MYAHILIVDPIEYGKMSTETHVAKTAPAFYTLPLQTAPDPLGECVTTMLINTLSMKSVIHPYQPIFKPKGEDFLECA